MALTAATTDERRHTLLRALGPDARTSAFRAANPVLFTELQLIAAEPQRIRRLDSDTACEAITWIDDPALLDAILEIERRQSVKGTIWRRRYDLEAQQPKPAPVKPHETRERTAAELTGSPAQVLEALGRLDDVDPNPVRLWFHSLPADQALEALPGLMQAAFLISGDAVSMLLDFLRDADRASAKTAIDILIDGDNTGRGRATAALRSWQGVWGFAPAYLALRLEIPSERLDATGVTADALELWRDAGRFDLVLRTGLGGDADVVGAAAAASSAEKALELLSLVSVARHVDLMIAGLHGSGVLERIANLSSYSMSRTIDRLLHVHGLSEETVRSLLGVASWQTLDTWLADGFPYRPTLEAVAAMAATMEPSEAVAVLSRAGRNGSEAGIWLLEAVTARKGGAEVVAELIQRSYTESNMVAWIATRASDVFGVREEAWAVFWSLLESPGQVSFDEMLAAVDALA